MTKGQIGNTPLVIFWNARQSSALDQADIGPHRNAGTFGVFSSVLDGETLTFCVTGEAYAAAETGSGRVLWAGECCGRARLGHPTLNQTRDGPL